MGAGHSQDCTTDPSKCKTDYSVTHSDVIRVQSILLDVHQSLRELERKQDELKSLVSTQNRLFNQQNEIITKFAQVIEDLSKSNEDQGQEIPEDSYAVSNNNNNNSLDDASICNFKGGSENHENVDYNSENKWDNNDCFYPVHTLSLGVGLGEFERTEKDEDARFNQVQENSNIPNSNRASSANAGSGEGIRRLLILDVTVILARLTSGNIDESAINLESLLLKGPVLNFNQFEIIAETILEKTIVETGRAGIFARLIQKVNVKLSAEHQEQWRHALVKTYHMNLHVTYSHLQDQSRRVTYLISELFRNHVIAAKNVIDVGDELLAKIMNNQDEIAAVNFHILLRKVGRSLEEDILHQAKSEGSSNKVGLSGNIIITSQEQELPNVNWLDSTFNSIRSIVTDNTKATSPSLRLSLRELLELRENNWESAQLQE